jgi:hypothetical protein
MQANPGGTTSPLVLAFQARGLLFSGVWRMSLNFMKPDIWDGLVLGTVLIGLALAILRLMSDRAAYKMEQEIQRRKAEKRSAEPEPNDKNDDQP